VLELLAWQHSRKSAPWVGFHPPSVPNDGARLRADRQTPSVTWIGHATTLIQSGGVSLLTDPIFGAPFGVDRLAPPGVAPRDLPPIDAVLISHNHRDHLDTDSVHLLGPKVRYLVPLGLAAWFRDEGLPNVTELDWWEPTEIVTPTGRATITLVPAQHWSQRAVGDDEKSLWGGYVIDAGGTRFYFAGDTGWPAAFPEIGRRFPGIDYAILPIGAYAPRWFMHSQHIAPDQAALAFRQLGARALVPMHWGTFHLSDEPMGEPPWALRAAMGKEVSRIKHLAIGGTVWGRPAEPPVSTPPAPAPAPPPAAAPPPAPPAAPAPPPAPAR
jgi:N-acyl-phosphatidylethanolamine-hydrolysing phospholipase D